MSKSKGKKTITTTGQKSKSSAGSTGKKTVQTSKKTVSTSSKTVSTKAKDPKRVASVARNKTTKRKIKEPQEFLFKRINFIWMGIGIGLIALGLLAMSGGAMPDPDTWDPSRIYSFRRITLAPILIVAGLAVEIYAIFKRA